jgi:hypothetical protein
MDTYRKNVIICFSYNWLHGIDQSFNEPIGIFDVVVNYMHI